MPLQSEQAYWDKRAGMTVENGKIRQDNWYKRPHQLAMLLEYNWLDQTVLEIGIGNALLAGAIKLISGGHVIYTGTELSELWRKQAHELFRLNVVNADVRELPDGPFTRIIAMDSLEHVRPEHRPDGYKRIAEVAAPGALLFIHLSRSPSYHDEEFDHPFGLLDLHQLEQVGFILNSYRRYPCKVKDHYNDYAFVVMQKNDGHYHGKALP